MVVLTILLFLVGLSAGSFVNALVWRLHQQQGKGYRVGGKTKKPLNPTPSTQNPNLSILTGRSMCVHCKHTLAWYDLIPVASWLSLSGKCRYCKKPISWQYPVVELTAAAVFAISYLFWPAAINQNGQWLLFSGWLAASVGLLALAVYDIRWLILPNRIIYPTLLVAVAAKLGYLLGFDPRPGHSAYLWLLSLVIASGVFFVLNYINDSWIGFGDVRLGLITGTLLAAPYKSLAMIFVASLAGTLVVLPSLKNHQRGLASKLPYGPYLIGATAIMVIWGDSLINWYKNLIT